ncbi:MAG: manganese efflux pump [Clostridia bacterium]|nr:manganese efflux pump [Clostridia bacterium]
MKNLVLFTTAFSVSLDSFFCGLSMSTKSNKNMSFLFGISSSVLILCLIGSTLGTKMRDFFENLGEILGGAILIIISFF